MASAVRPLVEPAVPWAVVAVLVLVAAAAWDRAPAVVLVVPVVRVAVLEVALVAVPVAAVPAVAPARTGVPRGARVVVVATVTSSSRSTPRATRRVRRLSPPARS